ncbi:MAG: hypothetical protein UMV23_03985 [Halanaerobium sp.]|nr:hypothetical protein [Halanaerobium sp.]
MLTFPLSSFLASFIIPIIISPFIVKFSWPYLIPRLFPGAIKQGLLVEDIPWSIAIILAVVTALVF